MPGLGFAHHPYQLALSHSRVAPNSQSPVLPAPEATANAIGC
ncbi:MAG TPA: hypothetical protein VN494_03085 [Patescibacteria group bacterium]|nr:hypothetical protein [Patescibacteria group bacterium]